MMLLWIKAEEAWGGLVRRSRWWMSIGLAALGSWLSPAQTWAQCWNVVHTATVQSGETEVAPHFGWSVAVDGPTMVVGAPWATNAAGARSGAAYVFVRSGASWALQSEITASDGAALDQFGDCVAIWGDRVVIGAPGQGLTSSSNEGAAYVFLRTGTAWGQEAKLTADVRGAQDDFGRSVAIGSSDVLIGAPGRTHSGLATAGSAYVFKRSGTAWTQQAALIPTAPAAGDSFGFSVAFARPGQLAPELIALVGAVGRDTAAGESAGAVFAFRREPGIDAVFWVQRAVLTHASASARDWFGYSIDASGGTAVVGIVDDDTAGGTNSGSAAVFSSNNSGTVWTEQVRLYEPGGTPGDRFGTGVAIVPGLIAVAGGGTDYGASSVTVFTGSGSAWTMRERLVQPTPVPNLGFARGMDVSGTTLACGAPDVSSSWATGRVWMHEVTTLSVATQPSPSTVCLSGAATFTVSGTGTSPIGYAWRRNGQPLDTGGTGATLLLTNVSAAHAGSYDCVLSNACGTAVSAPATLMVQAVDPDCNGVVNTADVGAFVSLWFAAASAVPPASPPTPADIDANGVVNPADVGAFVSLWFQAL